jgi:hypothetical protein
MLEKHGIACDLMNGFNWDKWTTGKTPEQIEAAKRTGWDSVNVCPLLNVRAEFDRMLRAIGSFAGRLPNGRLALGLLRENRCLMTGPHQHLRSPHPVSFSELRGGSWRSRIGMASLTRAARGTR